MAACQHFLSRCTSVGDCIIWIGPLDTRGYGLYNTGGITIFAHRYAYMAVHGLIPNDLHIHHKCRNHKCVNPEHLEAKTNSEHREIHASDPHVHSQFSIRPKGWKIAWWEKKLKEFNKSLDKAPVEGTSIVSKRGTRTYVDLEPREEQRAAASERAG